MNRDDDFEIYHALTNEEIRFLAPRVQEVEKLSSLLEQSRINIGTVIDLICKQNHLEGTWELDIKTKRLIKKD